MLLKWDDEGLDNPYLPISGELLHSGGVADRENPQPNAGMV
jgi:hypothetical protein